MTTITTKDGAVYAGIGLSESGNELELTITTGKRRVIPKADVAS